PGSARTPPSSGAAAPSRSGTRRRSRRTRRPPATRAAPPTSRCRPSWRAPAPWRRGAEMTPDEKKGGAPHVSVLLEEAVAALAPRDGAVYGDGTFGAGGYSGALLEAARCRVVGIDRDPAALARGAALAERHGDRLTLLEGRFGDMEQLLAAAG